MSDEYTAGMVEILYAYAARDDNWGGRDLSLALKARFDKALNAERARAWAEGFDAGHYSPSEEKACDCKANPYEVKS